MEGSKLTVLILILLGVLAIGATGYMQIEDMNLLDAMYMTSITVTTVGFEEVHPLSSEGKVFTIILMFAGIGIVIYTISYLGSTLVEPAIRRARFNHRTVDEAMILEEERETTDIIDIAGSKDNLVLKEVGVKARSPLNNKTKADILKRQGIVVMAMKDRSGNYKTGIEFHQKIKSGDILLLMGTPKELKKY